MNLDQERPVFLLGTGRCGSTYVQKEFCLNTNIWLWGEHDGILRGLKDWVERVKNNRNIIDFCFKHEEQPLETIIKNADRNTDNDIAWLNRFRTDTLDAVLRHAILLLCAANIPAGKTRWGFKEIRYGPDDRVAEALLAAFPKSSIIHLVRSPVATIESSMIAWRRQDIMDSLARNDASKIEEIYQEFATRWTRVTRYYLDLEIAYPLRVKTVRLEEFRESKVTLEEFLGINFLKESFVELEKINSAAHLAIGDLSATMADCKGKCTVQLNDLAKRCGYQT
ncbi:MAG: sulfotransferase [Roseiarcus sp.]